MKISNEQVQQLLQSQGVKGAGKTNKAHGLGQVQKADGAALSDASQEISKALSLIGKTSDVRTDKVAALKAQIEAGTYQVSGGDIALSILARGKVDALP